MIESTERFVVLSTAPDAQVAATLTRTMVEDRLAACANVVPAERSFYRWQARA